VHPTLGSLARFQAFFYTSAFFQSDGVPPPAPARVTQTVGRRNGAFLNDVPLLFCYPKRKVIVMIYFGMFRKFITPVVVLVLITACGTLQTISTPLPTTTTSPTIHPTEPPAQPCEGMTGNQSPSYTLVSIGAKAELLWKVEFVPWWVRSSPDGRILAVTDGGDSIFELKPDGGLAVAFRCPGVSIETAVAASDGAIWFAARDGGRLYRVPLDGKVSIMAQSGNRNLEAGVNGSVYAMENGLSRIDTDGTITKITDNISGRKFAVGPKGEIVALDNGNIVRISDSGEITKVASGYGP
jgi:hypothetical protein